MRKRSVLIRWFFSYLVILIIPMFLSMVIYLYSYRIINRNSEEIYAASLEQARTELDGLVNAVFQMLDQIISNRNVQKLTFVRDKPDPDDHWAIVQLVRDLINYPLISSLADDVFVSLNEINTIVSTIGYISGDLYYKLYYGNGNLGVEEFRNLVQKPHRKQDIYPAGDYLLFFKTTMEGTLSRSTATAVVAVKRSRFEERFANISGKNGTLMYIKDTANGTDYQAPDIQPESGPYHSLVLESGAANWKYVCLIPVNVQKEKARRIQLVTLGGLIICSLLGLFFSFRLTKRNYAPVKKLMSYFRTPEKNEPRQENEFDWLEKRTGEFFREHQDARLAIRKYYILNLLGKPFDPLTGKGEMERRLIRLEGEWNMVVIFTVPGSPSGGEVPGGIINVQETLIRIFGEVTKPHFCVEITGAGEHTAAIVNWPGNKDGIFPLLEEDIEYTQQKIEDLLHVSVLAALGEPHQGLEGIYYSNLEAEETVRYLDTGTVQSILQYRDIRHSGGMYQYTQEMEQKIINQIRAGDEEAACALLRQVFRANNFPLGLSGKMSRLLAYDILGTLIKGMEQGGGFSGDLQENLQNCNFEETPVGELPGFLEKIVRSICRVNRRLIQNKGSRILCEKVKEYIGEHFRNPDLNISLTGYHFGISPFYLSGIFREEAGLSLLEYINTLRIEAGKKLLEEGRNVTEIAEMTGFRGSGAFIRVFKKMTGVTPGQYKKIN
jgi:AraC-like DNA-binding protein